MLLQIDQAISVILLYVSTFTLDKSNDLFSSFWPLENIIITSPLKLILSGLVAVTTLSNILDDEHSLRLNEGNIVCFDGYLISFCGHPDPEAHVHCWLLTKCQACDDLVRNIGDRV